MLAAAILILLIIILIVLLLMVIHPIKKQESTVYIIGREEWPASYWNWYGGYGGWGTRPEHRWTAGPGYKPSGNWGPRYGDRAHSKYH